MVSSASLLLCTSGTSNILVQRALSSVFAQYTGSPSLSFEWSILRAVQSKEDEWFGGFGDLRDLCEHHSNDTNVDTAVRLTTTGDIV